MLNRSKTQKSGGGDLRSRIKHENPMLGAGTEMGGRPNQYGLHGNAFQTQAALQQQQQHHQQLYPAEHRRQESYSYDVAQDMGAGGGSTEIAAFAQNPSRYPSAQQSQPHPSALQQHRHLGAGPSLVSLSPSDSISNYEGRPGQHRLPADEGPGGGGGQPFEPSAGSTASFAQGTSADTSLASGPNMPHRPARSIRRPNRLSTMSTASVSAGPSPLRSNTPMENERQPHERGGGGGPRVVDRHARSARLMAQVHNMPDSGRDTPMSGVSDEEEAMERGSSRNGERLFVGSAALEATTPSPTSPPLGSLTQREQPAALSSVLSALSQAGRKQGQARILRGTTAEEESRRRRIERKVEAARSRESKPLEAYVDRADEKAFRQIGAVLRKAKTEWDFVVDDDFNSVGLAFSLMDDSSLGASFANFEQMKMLIERALQGTVDDHYESFATAISLHNNVLSSLSNAQGGVSAARRRLREARDALGAKRADLVQLWHRSQAVKESLRLLDTIDTLKGVPDRLESLMAEKQFLEAVNLLTRALKTCEKGEIQEVGAASDLRSYLKGQEQAMFDILIEELHNHLYLKSYFCDARWKAYTPGQSTLPNVEFGREYEDIGAKEANAERNAQEESSDDRGAGDQTTGLPVNTTTLKLFKYLKSLSTRPAPDSNLSGGDMPDLTVLPALSVMADDPSGSSGMTKSASIENIVGSTATAAGTERNAQPQNPETDSFVYIEMLLEALAKLGKIKVTQDVILQRLPTELHQMVDATIDEVDARSEMMRRSSVAVARPESLLLASSAALARTFAESTRNSFRSSFTGIMGLNSIGNSGMRLSTIESNQVERDCETMRDLFWTLFSKLDAVLQGHRVVFEVVSRISSRGASSAYRAVKVGKPSSLTEIWRPIQLEVRSLLHEYLVDESEGTSARRNATISINEILRQGSFQRDRSKAMFHLIADTAPKPGVNLSRKDFAPLRRHEDALTQALRASVPGLVGASDGAASSAIFQQHQHQQQRSFAMQARKGFADGAGHKLLVKPDAFNVSVLFQPALAFVDRVKLLLPPEAAGRGETEASANVIGMGFSKFLDEFVHDVFLQQLEDKVQTLFSTAVGGSDAFQEDAMSKSRTHGRPIVRSVANVIVLIDSLYAMLRTTPFHRQSYSLLILQVIVQYYQRCHERYGDLVSHENVEPNSTEERGTRHSSTLAAMWAQKSDIANCLSEMIAESTTSDRVRQLIELENNLELNLSSTLRVSQKANSQTSTRAGTVSLRDLTTSRKKLSGLGCLHHSLLWLYQHISKLHATEESAENVVVSSAPVARLSVTAMRSLQPASTLKTGDDATGSQEESLPLPLSHALVPRFKALPDTFKHLANLVLYTLRLEIRARTIHHLDLAVNEGNYLVEDAVSEPDPHVIDLNAELASLDVILAETLLPQHHRFLFSGLASLMDTHLCRAIRKIRYINRYGLTKMIRNIMALQQNLRNIVVVNETIGGMTAGTGKAGEESTGAQSPSFDNFDRCRRLWELVGKEPDQLLATIRQSGVQHSFEDYHAALNLALGLENGAAHSTASATATTPTSATPLSASQGPLPPNANLRPGTSDQPREVSRQKINEYREYRAEGADMTKQGSHITFHHRSHRAT